MEPDKKTLGRSPTGEAQNKVVQTYAEDMAEVLENEKGGSIKKIIHGEEEHEAERKNLSPESKKNKFFMILGMFLILASAVILSFLLTSSGVDTVPVAEQFVPIIFTDQSTSLELADLKKGGIEGKVLKEVNTTNVKPGGVDGIYLTLNKTPVGLRKFIELINGNVVFPSSTLVDDNFLMGVVGGDTGVESNDFFILLKIRSIPDIFDAMHAWESKMFSDLHGFFGVPIAPETKYLLTKNFEDGIMENKNARILYDTNHKIVMTYIFADDNSVIITDSENAVHEIMLRLASSQIKK